MNQVQWKVPTWKITSKRSRPPLIFEISVATSHSTKHSFHSFVYTGSTAKESPPLDFAPCWWSTLREIRPDLAAHRYSGGRNVNVVVLISRAALPHGCDVVFGTGPRTEMISLAACGAPTIREWRLRYITWILSRAAWDAFFSGKIVLQSVATIACVYVSVLVYASCTCFPVCVHGHLCKEAIRTWCGVSLCVYDVCICVHFRLTRAWLCARSSLLDLEG